ncbi:hypothetical protein FRB91_005509, partial [Serendipita sp. 411]
MLVVEEKQNAQLPAEEVVKVPLKDDPDKTRPLDESPPPYQDTHSTSVVAGPSTSSNVDRGSAPIRFANYTQVITPNKSISGRFDLDLALPLLPYLGPSRPSPLEFVTCGESRPNLLLSSSMHPISSSIHIKDSSATSNATPKRALLVAENRMGNITLDIASREPNIRVHICAISEYRNIIVRIPKDFVGPIRVHIKDAARGLDTVRYTPRVNANMTMLSVEENYSYAFIGDLSLLHNASNRAENGGLSVNNAIERESYTPGQSTTSTTPATPVDPNQSNSMAWWDGDQVEIINTYGRVKICYSLQDGEEKETEDEFKTIARQLKETGPIVALVKAIYRNVNKV